MSKKRIKGELPTGCRICTKGAKAVYFLTGRCDQNCFYCPVSEEKKNNSTQWINEREIESNKDLSDEIKKMKAEGVAITGGEPYNEKNKLIKQIKYLKKEFGKDFHIHLYTSKPIEENYLNKLNQVGLDEIRFHPTNLSLNKKLIESIKKSNKYIREVGLEIPAIPDKLEEIKKLIRETRDYIDFLNLNEFEYSEKSFNELKEKGYVPKQKTRQSIKGSEEVAKELIQEINDLTIHFCPSHFKDNTQLRKRFIRRAKNIAKDHEAITEEGTIVKGIIKTKKPDLVKSKLIKKDVPNNLFVEKNQEIEVHWEVLDKLSEELKELSEDQFIVEQHPTENRLVLQEIPV